MTTREKVFGYTTSGVLAAASLFGFSGIADAQTVLTNSDGIVRNSLCVGSDCQSGVSFSDSTVILKENNTRLKFSDTSTGSFPANDWEIEANSSLNGGASYLGFNDCGTGSNDGSCAADLVFAVEAGARQSALYVESDGDVGIGTSNPVAELHIVRGDTPTVRLEQDGSSGFSPQVWDLAGNETSFFIRDASNGSTLPFRIRPGAPSQALVIDTDGDVGIGTLTADAKLHTKGTGTQQALFESSDGGAVQVRMKTNSTNRRFLALDGSNVVKSQILFNDNNIQFLGQTGANLWATFSAAGIITSGAGACNPGPCDLTFDPEAYKVESIEEHSEYMWANKHLWGVGPTIEGEPINLTKKTTGILHELEKAHIYIEQLNDEKKQLQGKVDTLETRLAKVEMLLNN